MVKIDLDKCIKCKSCIRDCFPENIILQNDEISIKGPCMMCGHCVAICPTKAISFEGYEDSEELKNLNYNIEADTFLNFVKARRSIRHFKEKKIEKKIIEKFRLKRNVTCACMLIGYPDISYKRTAPRKNINVEWL